MNPRISASGDMAAPCVPARLIVAVLHVVRGMMGAHVTLTGSRIRAGAERSEAENTSGQRESER